MAVEGIRTMAAGEFVPNRLKKRHRRRPNELPVGSFDGHPAVAAVIAMFFPLASGGRIRGRAGNAK